MTLYTSQVQLYICTCINIQTRSKELLLGKAKTKWVDFLSTCWFGTGLTGRLQKQQWQKKPKKSGSNYSCDFGRPKNAVQCKSDENHFSGLLLFFSFYTSFDPSGDVTFKQMWSYHDINPFPELKWWLEMRGYKNTSEHKERLSCTGAYLKLANLYDADLSMWSVKEFKIWLNAIENYHKYAMSSCWRQYVSNVPGKGLGCHRFIEDVDTPPIKSAWDVQRGILPLSFYHCWCSNSHDSLKGVSIHPSTPTFCPAAELPLPISIPTVF